MSIKSNIFQLLDVNSLPGGKFAGGLLLSVLATTSSVLDHYLRRVNAGFAIGFTSVLIIVSARRILVIILCMQLIGNTTLSGKKFMPAALTWPELLFM